MTANYIGVAVFFVLSIAFVAGTFTASWFLRPHRPYAEKLTTYECGERPVGGAWVQFRIVFYLFTLAFVLFDVEVVFIIPWAIVVGDFAKLGLGVFVIAEMLVFLAILLVGWLFALRRGVFNWE
jgi:NADH-quinone oxidoreductase subunit A